MDTRHLMGSRTRLVMRVAHWSKPLALASLTCEFALTGATLARSQADPVLFLITKRVHEPWNLMIYT